MSGLLEESTQSISRFRQSSKKSRPGRSCINCADDYALCCIESDVGMLCCVTVNVHKQQASRPNRR